MDKTTDVSFHDERDKTDSEEIIDKSFLFNEKNMYLNLKCKNIEMNDQTSKLFFFEWQELNESEKIAERILPLLSLRDGGV